MDILIGILIIIVIAVIVIVCAYFVIQNIGVILMVLAICLVTFLAGALFEALTYDDTNTKG